jgi:hypothetical protein
MAVHRLGFVAGDREGGARPFLPGMVDPDDLDESEDRDDQAWYWVAWPG